MDMCRAHNIAFVFRSFQKEHKMVCAADGWIDERWEHTTSALSKLSSKSPAVSRGVR